MGYENLQKIYFRAKSAASVEYLDLDAAAAVVLTILPDAKEKMYVYAAGIQYATAVTANGFNTTAPVVACSFDSANAGSPTEKATKTVTLNAAKAVGQEEFMSDFAPFIVNGALGDALEFSIKTQGAGATTTGEAVPFVYAKLEPVLDGV